MRVWETKEQSFVSINYLRKFDLIYFEADSITLKWFIKVLDLVPLEAYSSVTVYTFVDIYVFWILS